jgi:glucose-6-phosphate 1-dehydrogenase
MLVVVVFGASGDLARRKTYPALFSLYRHKFLPEEFRIYGYARSELTTGELHDKLMPFLKKQARGHADQLLLERFLGRCEYSFGAYDKPDGYLKLRELIDALPVDEGHLFSKVRVYYLALPPSVFVPVAQQIRATLYDPSKQTRVIVEKPFGKDLQSSNELSAALAPLFVEDELFRIDHYLGKEMVKNIMILRFANVFFNAIWNRQYIASVQIVFKETQGVEGRGGYFDEFGIIRDVMQNHLLQMLTVIAMERPATLGAEDVRDEKVKVLRCIPPIVMEDIVLGQYKQSADGSKPGYLDDETIDSGSNTATFAMATLRVENERWAGVPFVLRCGKALNEQKAEIRIQFADVPGCLFPNIARNELVIRVQPNEAVYMKMMVKRPGLESSPIVSDLDLSYASRYVDLRIPEAYEALILDALRGDRSNFVRGDELEHAWKIFTPILHEIDAQHTRPLEYPVGSRGPPQADERLRQLGFIRNEQEYTWPKQQL